MNEELFCPACERQVDIAQCVPDSAGRRWHSACAANVLGDSGSLAELDSENAQLRERCANLEDEVDRLQRQVNHLSWRTTERKKITLCGSTRFKKAFFEWNARLTAEGNVVLSVAMWGLNVRYYPSPELKALLDEVHLAKIKDSDEIFVLDVDGYIGESTAREIAYAVSLGKPVRYLSKEFPNWTEGDCIYFREEVA